MFSDPEVIRHLDGALSPAAASALFDGILDGRRARVAFAWIATPRSGGAPLGHGALLRDGDALELGYVLPRSAWGRGYATEIGGAIVAFAARPVGEGGLGRRRLVATVDVSHPPSIRVLEKLGLSRIDREQDGDGEFFRYAKDFRLQRP